MTLVEFAPVETTDGTVDLARDRTLVEQCQNGDSSAFDDLYRRYRKRLFRACYQRLHEAGDAEDAVQETFVRAWRALPRFTGDRKFYPWLTVIARNVCTDILRQRGRVTPMEDVEPAMPPGTDVGENIVQQVDAVLVSEALRQLSARHRRVLKLREGHGWSTRRVAEHEGVTVAAAETLLWRAREALKREFTALTDAAERFGGVVSLGVLALRRFIARVSPFGGQKGSLVQSMFDHGPASLAAVAVVAGLAGGAALMSTTLRTRPAPTPAVSPAPGTIAPGLAPYRSLGPGGAGGSLTGPLSGSSTDSLVPPVPPVLPRAVPPAGAAFLQPNAASSAGTGQSTLLLPLTRSTPGNPLLSKLPINFWPSSSPPAGHPGSLPLATVLSALVPPITPTNATSAANEPDSAAAPTTAAAPSTVAKAVTDAVPGVVAPSTSSTSSAPASVTSTVGSTTSAVALLPTAAASLLKSLTAG